MGTKLLLLNGPSRSGKDTIGGLLKEMWPDKVYLTKFSILLKELTYQSYGLDVPHDHFEDRKDEPCEEFGGLTVRGAIINYWTTVFLPKHGPGAIGAELGESLLQMTLPEWVVITDSGFAAEARSLGNVLAPERTVVAEIHRPGCDFRNDSRSHWWTPSLVEEDSARGEPWWDQPEHFTWVNSGPLEKLKDRVITWANRIGLH